MERYPTPSNYQRFEYWDTLGTRKIYISDQKLFTFMQSRDEVANATLLRESSHTKAEAHINLIRKLYPRVPIIFLCIGHGSLVSRVCSLVDFEDNRGPFGFDQIRALSE